MVPGSSIVVCKEGVGRSSFASLGLSFTAERGPVSSGRLEERE